MENFLYKETEVQRWHRKGIFLLYETFWGLFGFFYKGMVNKCE